MTIDFVMLISEYIRGKNISFKQIKVKKETNAALPEDVAEVRVDTGRGDVGGSGVVVLRMILYRLDILH